MLTAEEVKAIPLFSSLSERVAERLVQIAADVHLAAGEFAIHEGEERAFFAVVAGKMEVVNWSTVSSAFSVGVCQEPFSAKCQPPWARRSQLAFGQRSLLA